LAPRQPAFTCDVSGLERTDLGTVDALARVALRLRGEGAALRLHGASTELRNLIALAGLARILACHDEAGGTVNQDAAAGRRAGRSARCRGRT
jgi:ABC-type transporter Mla MlaB component